MTRTIELLERKLKEAVLAGDEEAWELLYRRTMPAVRGFVGQRVDAERVEDVLQETWMVAVRKIRTFAPERSRFSTWVCGIAARLVKGADRRRPAETLPDAVPAVPENDGELRARLDVALAALPTGYRRVLEARYEDDLPVAEIAQRHGTTVKAIESRLARARVALRAAFGTPVTGDET